MYDLAKLCSDKLCKSAFSEKFGKIKNRKENKKISI